MKVDPFTGAWLFLIGATSDQEALGAARYPSSSFLALLAASMVIARANWRADPAQRTAAYLWTWLFRVLIGIIWFQGALWKLPLPVSGALQYWTEGLLNNPVPDRAGIKPGRCGRGGLEAVAPARRRAGPAGCPRTRATTRAGKQGPRRAA